MNRMDKGVHDLVDQVKHALVPGTVFEEMGLRYFGVYDGHDLQSLLDVIGTIQDQPGVKLLHVLTVKGKGVEGCEDDPLALHGVKPGQRLFLTGEGQEESCGVPKEADKVEPRAAASGAEKSEKYDYARCFSEVVVEEGERHPDLVTITAGMPDGTGLVPFQERFPERFFNVGIAEQHGVAFASGLTVGGRRPVVALYSTFMQRGYDQVFQEVALQRSPVILMLSHGGLAGEDGATHHGLFDIPILRTLPGITLMAPRDGAELQAMFRFALTQDGPVAIRYPKASTRPPKREVEPLESGRAEVLRDGRDVALVGYGPMSELAEEAAGMLEGEGISAMVVNARFARPLDQRLLRRLLTSFSLVVTVEEGALAGGFGSAILEFSTRVPHARARIHPVAVPDRFVEHGKRELLLAELGISAEGIRDCVLRLTREAAKLRTAP
jgi:1-deoxy-D-xylulose-5-phosphate synthase